MKRFITAVALTALMAQDALAQEPGEKTQRSIYVEAFGASNLVGLNYDSRFKPSSPWGYRVGLAFTYSEQYNMFSGSNSLRGPAVPIEVNYLTGRKNSHLDIGFGLNLGYYTEKYDTWTWKDEKMPDGTYHVSLDYAGEEKHSLWGYYFYGNIGYRYQRPRGFQFRAGINPSFNLGGSHAVTKAIFPYVSFGYSF